MKRLKLTILLAIAAATIALGSSTRAQIPVNENQTDEVVLRHLKKVLWKKAYREQDTKLLDRILAPEFQVIYDDGSWSDKKGELERIRKNKPTYDSFVYTIKRLDIFENGTAIISGEGHVKGRNLEGSYEYKYQSSNVLIKREGGWQAISSHVSGVKRKEEKKDN